MTTTQHADLYYQSFTELRASHTDLLRRQTRECDPAFLAIVERHIRRGTATGVLLDAESERWEAQSLLDFWVTVLDRCGHSPPDSTLDVFDPALAPTLDDSLCPYRGLEAFKPKDRGVFFGRAAIIDATIQHLRNHRLLVVVGPSGSGKSSVVLAGLLPSLADGAIVGSDRWRVLGPIVPGSDPLGALAALILPPTADAAAIRDEVQRLRGDPRRLASAVDPHQPTLVVIDQCEELFTLSSDETVWSAFVENLTHLIESPGARHVVILTLRSDFEPHVARIPLLQRHVQRSTIRVTPLSASELRDAVMQPAAAIGLRFEEGLVDQLIHDFLGEPAGLPLLQFTLLKLWERREKNRITRQAYRRLGDGRKALANTADALWSQLLPEEQATARRIFLRLVQPSQGLEITSRRVMRAELYRTGEANDRVDRVLQKLLDARLLRTTPGKDRLEERVEVAHEALVRNWPQLTEWLDQARVTLRRRLQFRATAQQWDSQNRNRHLLLPKLLVEEVSQYDDLDPLEAEFIARSRASHLWLRRAKNAVLAALTAAVVVIPTLVVNTRQNQRLFKAEVSAKEAMRRRADSLAMALRKAEATALAVASLSNLPSDPELSVLLATAANSMSGSGFTENALNEAVQKSRVRLRLTGHRRSVWGVDFSPDGSRVVSVSSKGVVRLMDARSGNVLKRFLAHSGDAVSVAFSPDGKYFATGGEDGVIRIWDAVSTKLARVLPDAGWVLHVSYSADGHRLVSAASSTVKVWDPATGRAVLSLRGHRDRVWSAAFSPDGKRIVTASADGDARMWDAVSGKTLFVRRGSRAGDPLACAAYAPDGRTFVTGTARGSFTVWNAANGNQIRTLGADIADVCSVSYSPDGRRIAGGEKNGSTRVWDAASGKLILRATSAEPVGHDGDVSGLAFSLDGQRLARGNFEGGVDVLDAETGGRLASMPAEPAAVNAVAFAGNRLATAGGDFVGRIWDATTGTELVRLSGHTAKLRAIAFSPEETRIATAADDGTAKIWDAATAREMISVTHANTNVQAVAFNPDGTRLATADAYGSVFVWNAATGKRALSLDGHGDAVWGIAYSPNGARIVTGSGDKTAIVWDAWSGKKLLTLRGHTEIVMAVAYSSDGKRIATGGWDGTAVLWDAATGDSVLVLRGHRGPVVSVAFDSHGRLATGSYDRKIKIWNGSNGEELQTISGHEDAVYGLAFNPSGTELASASWDGTARVWDLWATSEMIARRPGEGAAIAMSPRDRRFATEGATGDIWIWDADRHTRRSTLHGHKSSIISLAYNHDGSRLASSSYDSTARIWNTSSGESLLTLTGHSNTVWDVTFSPDGKRVVTGSWDSTAVIWDVDSGKRLRTLRHGDAVYAVAVSPDGSLIATAGKDSRVIVWDAMGAMAFELVHSAQVWDVVFSPDGQQLVSAVGGGEVKVWDVRTHHELHSLSGHTFVVFRIAYGADGKRLATASWDGTARVWDTSTGMQLFVFSDTSAVNDVAFDEKTERLLTIDRAGEVRSRPLTSAQLMADAGARVTRPLSRDECNHYPSACQPIVQAGAVADNSSAGAARRPLPPGPVPPDLTRRAAVLTAKARRLAEAGDLTGAAQALGDARQLDSSLRVQPESDPKSWRALHLQLQADRLAQAGDTALALEQFRALKALRPQTDPRAEVRSQRALGLMSEAWIMVENGHVTEAIEQYARLSRDSADREITANAWNQLCWFGSLWNRASQVLFACELAVRGDPASGGIRDSRGVARAMTSDYAGAIEDFCAYVRAKPAESDRRQREDWIRTLAAGRNPFTPEVLEKVRLAIVPNVLPLPGPSPACK